MEIDMHPILVSPKDIGATLRDLRKRRGLSQAELGRRVGLDQQKVSLIENGNPNTRLDSLLRLLSALGVGLILQSKQQPPSSGDSW
jgi:HTH-type transcriptional regulator / antitoxin HipB